MNALRARWRGDVPTARVLWVDMLLIGSLVNLLASFAALIAVSQRVADPLAVLLHLAPLPLNVWLLLVVFRARPRTAFARAVAVGWFAVMVVV
ncbi:MAG: hypothetical protein AB7P21_25600 [Lautropia sp.]